MITETKVIHSPECRCLSWKPVVAGALVAIGLTFLLNLFSVAIGLTAYSTSSEGVETLALGGLIGTGIGIVASMFAAGWIAGYLGRSYCNLRHIGAIYGFLTWCLALIVSVFVAMQAHEYVHFYADFISGAANSFQLPNAGPAAAAAAVTATATNLSTNNLIISTYIIFILFFLSAFACSLGGHCGMRHKYNENL